MRCGGGSGERMKLNCCKRLKDVEEGGLMVCSVL